MWGGRGAGRPAVVTRAWGAETIARPAGDTSRSRCPAERRRGPARPPGQGRGAGLHVVLPAAAAPPPRWQRRRRQQRDHRPGPRGGGGEQQGGVCCQPASPDPAGEGSWEGRGAPRAPYPRRRPFPARSPAPKGVVQTFPPGG